ncbi:MAG: RNA pseudouridine synthase [Oligoflexia bacterium]|nr:RNA pseudouridine synthase [Oligoflexia bacterium]
MSKLRIEYEDEHILVVYKPAGLLSQKSKKGDLCVTDLVHAYYKSRGYGSMYAGLIHRLDRPVGGPLLIAKTKRAAELFSRAVKNRRVQKTYKAIVFGIPEITCTRLVHYIRNTDGMVAGIGTEENREFKLSELELELIKSGRFHDIALFENSFSLVSVNLITGRKHQIRAQLSAIGHPIVGDSKYFNIEGAERKNFSGEVLSGMNECNFLPWGEIALYCDYLGFRHPLDNGRLVEVRIEYPRHWIKIP